MRLDVLLALASLKQFHYQLYIGDVALATALRSMALIKPQFTWTVSIKLLFPNYLTSFFSVCNKGVRRGHNRTRGSTESSRFILSGDSDVEHHN